MCPPLYLFRMSLSLRIVRNKLTVWLLPVAIWSSASAIAVKSAGAQQPHDVRVRLEAEPGRNLAGALVALVDSANRVYFEALSNERGLAALRALPGSYRVRVRRIGYRPYYSAPVILPREADLLIRVESPRVVLNTMVVSARAQCESIDRDAATLSEVWEEIAKALRASQLTSEDLSAIGYSSVFDRDLDERGVVLSADTSILPAARGRPFAAVEPQRLQREGYVRGNEALGWEYFGPDEAVLLSSGFAETHCFRVVRDKERMGEIGAAFEPVARRRIPDIKGVLWVDEESSELREITFRYVNADVVSMFEPGGFTRFQRMPSGAWIVNDWLLRMPKLGRRKGSFQNDLIGHIERGGTVVGPTALRREPTNR